MARSAMTRMSRHTASAATRCSHRRSTTTPTRQSIRTTRTRTRLPLSTTLPSNPRAAPSPHSLSPRLHPHTTRAHAHSRLHAHPHVLTLATVQCVRHGRGGSASTASRPIHTAQRAPGHGQLVRALSSARAGGVVSVSQHWGRPAHCDVCSVVMDARRKALAPSSALRHHAARSHGCGHSGRGAVPTAASAARARRAHFVCMHAAG